MPSTNMISIIAELKAKPGKIESLKAALSALIMPTRQEPGCFDYMLFQLRDEPNTFYVRESWRGQQGLDDHINLPHFQHFIAQMDDLLAVPLKLTYLNSIEPA